MEFNTDKMIDSRDVIARIVELEGGRDNHEECGLCHGADGPISTFANPEPHTCVDCGGTGKQAASAWHEACPDDAEELAALVAFAEEMSDYVSDWRHGAALIRDDHFPTYARKQADYVEGLREAVWPMCYIDWDAAADALKADYTSAELDGETYWGRM